MVSTLPGSEVALPHGAALLSATEQNQVAGGSAYYDLFFWIGEHLGFAERAREDWLVASNDAPTLLP